MGTLNVTDDASYGLYSYGLHSYGLYSYGLYSYGLYSYGLHRYGLYSYGLYSYGLRRRVKSRVPSTMTNTSTKSYLCVKM